MEPKPNGGIEFVMSKGKIAFVMLRLLMLYSSAMQLKTLECSFHPPTPLLVLDDHHGLLAHSLLTGL
jgi:hypothetical protein